MAFLESPRFPDAVSYGAVGGPRFSTDVVQTAGGKRLRNRRWVRALWEFAVTLPMVGTAEHLALRAFFLAMAGQYGAFRFKDWSDYTDEGLGILGAGVGDGTAGPFQMRKRYVFGALDYLRDIVKPVPATGQVFVAGVERPQGAGAGKCLVDTTTGLVTFGVPYPTSGQALTWVGEFDVPCGLGADKLDLSLDGVTTSSWSQIPIVEDR